MPNSFRFRSAQTVFVLAITQLAGWGTTFDMLGVMGRIVAPDLGMANEVAFAGLTIMMTVSAIVGPATGRWLGRYGAARVLSAASLTFAIGLSLLAAANGVILYAAAWIVIGAGGALGLSAPAYTAVVEREGMNGKGVIAVLMLFTGLSSAIFWPVLSLLNETVGWRFTFLALFPPREFGLQSARLSLPQNLANAIAPVVFTAILDRAGTGPALFAAAVLAALSLTLVLMLMTLVRGARATQPSPAPS
ncbi:hypothetical protein [Rhizobium binae]|uniref:hypothetical protein n=1 Tax=Rhizobium binae TaxID=1138190 RepID=UPI001C832B75|nr:hypothetical protein [Rhizobium binae]MBX4928232.1 hypothetical protein [Rhizobium binae]MBX4950817.1 hypothetical protein [Rhizobium binae]